MHSPREQIVFAIAALAVLVFFGITVLTIVEDGVSIPGILALIIVALLGRAIWGAWREQD